MAGIDRVNVDHVALRVGEQADQIPLMTEARARTSGRRPMPGPPTSIGSSAAEPEATLSGLNWTRSIFPSDRR